MTLNTTCNSLNLCHTVCAIIIKIIIVFLFKNILVIHFVYCKIN